jgi:hypothetical protein
MDSANVTPDLAARIREPALRRFYAYWLERKGARRFPARRDIDPLDFAYLLGNVLLLDVLRNPLRFRVRLHGTEMVSRAIGDMTGKLLDALPESDYRSYVIDRCEGVLASGEPTLVHHDEVLQSRRRLYEALWLPFADDGETICMLLCAIQYRKRRP